MTQRELAHQMVGALRQCPESPERAAHILKMIRIAEGADAEGGEAIAEAGALCEACGAE